jgi:hypothetical protein
LYVGVAVPAQPFLVATGTVAGSPLEQGEVHAANPRPAPLAGYETVLGRFAERALRFFFYFLQLFFELLQLPLEILVFRLQPWQLRLLRRALLSHFLFFYF